MNLGRYFSQFAALLLAVSVLHLSQTANAFIELKGGYSLLSANPTTYNNSMAPREAVKSMQGLTADFLLNAAVMPINIGARYEDFTFDKGSGATQSKADFQRISVILDKRFIDTVGYLGMVATVGLSNEFKDKLANTKAASSLSGSIGLETGFKLGFLMFGIEGGYLIAPLGELKNSAGAIVTSAGANVTVDMSGIYGRALVGLNF